LVFVTKSNIDHACNILKQTLLTQFQFGVDFLTTQETSPQNRGTFCSNVDKVKKFRNASKFIMKQL